MQFVIHRLALAAAVATLAISLGAGAALASEGIELRTRSGNPRVLAEGRFTFFEPEMRFTIACNVQIIATINRRVFKVAREPAGQIISAGLSGCSGGESIVMREAGASLPWTLGYQGFTGTLPNIRELRLSLTNFTVLYALRPIWACAYGATLQLRTSGNPIREAMIEEATLPVVEQSLSPALCFRSLTFRGVITWVEEPIGMRLI